MDLSKLPRLSETDKHAPPPPAAEATPAPSAYPPPPAVQQVTYGPANFDISGQVWLSAVLGIVFMFMGGTFARFAIAKMTGQPFHTGATWQLGPKAGQEVDYFDLEGYTAYTDAAIFLFGLAMVLEAGMLIVARNNTPASRAFVTLALGISALMTLLNIVLVGALFHIGITPFVSFLAAAFGAYMTATEWKMLQFMRATRG